MAIAILLTITTTNTTVKVFLTSCHVVSIRLGRVLECCYYWVLIACWQVLVASGETARVITGLDVIELVTVPELIRNVVRSSFLNKKIINLFF